MLCVWSSGLNDSRLVLRNNAKKKDFGGAQRVYSLRTRIDQFRHELRSETSKLDRLLVNLHSLQHRANKPSISIKDCLVLADRRCIGGILWLLWFFRLLPRMSFRLIRCPEDLDHAISGHPRNGPIILTSALYCSQHELLLKS